MGASITLAGESLIAQKQAAHAGLKVSRFIFANVPGLDANGPVDRAAGKPVAGQIVHTHQILDGNAGYVSPNQVVYSSQIGSDVGDWDFNWIGLESVEGVLFAVAYVPLQQKRRNIPPLQIGNNLTRNFLLVFDGAQALTGLTIDAKTWQHDFTVRLAGIDERERQSNRDVFGRACFFGSSLQVEKVGGVYQVNPGTAYIEGIRLQRSAVLPIVPPALPVTVWLDVALQRELSDVVASWQVVFGAQRPDYTDSAGVQHYCVPVADLSSGGLLTDRRSVEAIDGPLVTHFAARIGDYPQLRARATTKGDVGLDQIPNAISDDQDVNSSQILATTRALKAATATLWTAIANVVSGATVVGRAAKLATARTISVAGAVVGSMSFDGSDNVTLSVVATPATESGAGAAKVATQLQTDAGTDDTAYITPKKMRWGFSASLTANGYLELPTWLGGLLINWGTTALGPEGIESLNITYPKAYSSFCRVLPNLWFTGSRIENSNYAQIRDRTLTGFKLDNQWTNNGSNLSGTVDWISIGK
ncbi:phage tail protein [Pseudomonas sp. Mn2068]|uniref:phage tail-collar fiber domain-containing protein n=1 Tax=Pseudomonas sp. Mn2068 TaxID=3395265 RepID=UPI003BE8827C